MRQVYVVCGLCEHDESSWRWNVIAYESEIEAEAKRDALQARIKELGGAYGGARRGFGNRTWNNPEWDAFVEDFRETIGDPVGEPIYPDYTNYSVEPLWLA